MKFNVFAIMVLIVIRLMASAHAQLVGKENHVNLRVITSFMVPDVRFLVIVKMELFAIGKLSDAASILY